MDRKSEKKKSKKRWNETRRKQEKRVRSVKGWGLGNLFWACIQRNCTYTSNTYLIDHHSCALLDNDNTFLNKKQTPLLKSDDQSSTYSVGTLYHNMEWISSLWHI